MSAALPGASADIMASSVATPLERQFGHIAGVTEMTSASSLGSTSITIQFDLSRDIDGAARDVRGRHQRRSHLSARQSAGQPDLPQGKPRGRADHDPRRLPRTSTVRRSSTTKPLRSSSRSCRKFRASARSRSAAARCRRCASRRTRRSWPATGSASTNLKAVLSLQNADLAKGQLSDGTVTADILANDQISAADDYRPLVVGYHNGAAVRLSDVADVTDSVQNIRAAGYLNGSPAMLVIIFRQPGANIISTVDRIRAQLPFIQASIPFGINTTIVLDRTTTIRASVSDVERTLLISVLLVIVVVFVFLRSARATLIPAVAVPVSLLGTLRVMYLFGYSLDNLSLMALTISTGFVVDDAIVVMENITRHLEAGMKPFDAALKGAAEIGLTVFTISVSLIAVFIPLLLMGGIVGRLFREFAVTLSTAILVSMVLSLTTTPMMCAFCCGTSAAQSTGACTMPASGPSTPCCRLYRSTPALGSRSSAADAAGAAPDHRAQRGCHRQDPQGVLPSGGHWRTRRRGARAPGRVVPGDG